MATVALYHTWLHCALPCCCPADLEGVPLTAATVTRFGGEGYLYAGRPGFGAKGPPEESSTEGCVGVAPEGHV